MMVIHSDRLTTLNQPETVGVNVEDKALKILVIEDHELFYKAICSHLKEKYSDAEFISVKTAVEAKERIDSDYPHLVIMDLSIPEKFGDEAHVDTGIKLLKFILNKYPKLNITIQSGFVKALIRIKSAIDNHEGGFTIADKGLATQDILKRVDWALDGLPITIDLGRKIIEMEPKYQKLLSLASKEGLQDKVIAQRMNIAVRTVRNYWEKIQDLLEIYPKEKEENQRIVILKCAREKGFID